MCKRFNFDNCISLIGSWLLFILSCGFWFLCWSLFEYFHQRKYSVPTPFLIIFIESLHELTISYWWSC